MLSEFVVCVFFPSLSHLPVLVEIFLHFCVAIVIIKLISRLLRIFSLSFRLAYSMLNHHFTLPPSVEGHVVGGIDLEGQNLSLPAP